MSEATLLKDIEPDIRQYVLDASVAGFLHDYVVDGDPAHIVEAIRECARWGLPLPAPLARALPALARALPPSRNLSRRSLEILHKVAAALGPPPHSSKALKRIGAKHKMSEKAVRMVLQRNRQLFESDTPARRVRILNNLEE